MLLSYWRFDMLGLFIFVYYVNLLALYKVGLLLNLTLEVVEILIRES